MILIMALAHTKTLTFLQQPTFSGQTHRHFRVLLCPITIKTERCFIKIKSNLMYGNKIKNKIKTQIK